jgi:uncharacterized glyoxalase superfamily protein PhnB
MAVKTVPEGYHTVTPYLVVPDAAAVIDFVTAAFGATLLHAARRPDGSIMHAEVQVGDSRVMIGQSADRAMRAMLYLYVPDVDATYRQAVAAGGVSIAEPADQFYGDRHGAVSDPAGNQWWIATHFEDVSPDEVARRAQSQAPPAAG